MSKKTITFLLLLLAVTVVYYYCKQEIAASQEIPPIGVRLAKNGALLIQKAIKLYLYNTITMITIMFQCPLRSCLVTDLLKG